MPQPRASLFAIAVATIAAAVAPLPGQDQAPARAPAANLGLDALIAWRNDGAEFHEKFAVKNPEVDRSALVDAACAEAKTAGRLVLWYIPRIQEKGLGGRQMYRAPVLDVYMRQVLFTDPDVAELVTWGFVPLRCMLDQQLSDRFGLKPLAFVEPAVVFLDGDGNVVHFVERIRTFHAQWFADLCGRVLEHAAKAAGAPAALQQRRQGLWRPALAELSNQADKDAATWLAIARLQRLLRQPEPAFASLRKAEALLAPGGTTPQRRRGANPPSSGGPQLGDLLCERGLLLSMTGDLLTAQPVLEQAFRSGASRAAEAGYWHALNALRLGDEMGAMRRLGIVAERHPGTPFGARARANTVLAPDDRPFGAAFTGFESLAYLPESAYQGLQRDTTWSGDPLAPRELAAQALRFLLQQQRDDGGFTDSRYAYWPDSEITPNVWVAITAIALTALHEYRGQFPDLAPRIDRALARGELFVLDDKRLNRGANEDCYSDAYRLMYLARRAATDDPNSRAHYVQQMNAIVEQAARRQKPSGFWAHEYENAFASGAVLQQMLAAKAAGATVPDEVTDKGASALLSARTQNGTYVYGGAAGNRATGNLKDSAGRMPVCEGTLLVLGRSDLDKVRFALQNFWQHMQNLDGVRRNDFHSDGELGGFFFFHSLFHASEVVRLLPDNEQQEHWPRFREVLQRIPELDGSFLDSHELGRSYGTAMALLTLKNAATP